MKAIYSNIKSQFRLSHYTGRRYSVYNTLTHSHAMQAFIVFIWTLAVIAPWAGGWKTRVTVPTVVTCTRDCPLTRHSWLTLHNTIRLKSHYGFSVHELHSVPFTLSPRRAASSHRSLPSCCVRRHKQGDVICLYLSWSKVAILTSRTLCTRFARLFATG